MFSIGIPCTQIHTILAIMPITASLADAAAVFDPTVSFRLSVCRCGRKSYDGLTGGRGA